MPPLRALVPLLALFLFGLYARAAEIVYFSSGWRFHLGDIAEAELATTSDENWRTVSLPHDWSIEGNTALDAPSAGGGGFFPTGVGWYRRTFLGDQRWRGKRVLVEFDGIYRDSEVWLNGHSLGRRPSGFVPFRYDLTPHLRIGAPNLLAIRADNSAQPNSRYYTGSGLYRDARMVVTEPVCLERDGISVVTTNLQPAAAQIRTTVEVRNTTDQPRPVLVVVEYFSRDDRKVARGHARPTIPPQSLATVTIDAEIPQPQPWSPDSPHLYLADIRLGDGNRQLDHVKTAFGVRSVRVSSERGFELNGVPLKLYGGNIHDDNGPLGAAAFDRAEVRRAELLKAAGFNAVRTAHNPPAPAFLDACDRLGLLAIVEAFDGWKSKKLPQDYGRVFDEWSERDLEAVVRRDRNHPSVVMWSIGNEPYERGKPSGAAIAQKLANLARSLDPTRPVTAGINGLGEKGDWQAVDPVFAALDVAGYNYEIHRATTDHARLPQRVIYAAESYQRDAFASWSAVHAAPCVIGDFVWSAMDYLGEAGIGRVFPPDEPVRAHWEGSHFPWHGAACGDIDLIGQRRPLSHYRNIVWDRGEKLYAAVRVPTPDSRPWNLSLWAAPPLASHWTWPGQEGRPLEIEVYSRHDSVRLYLNNRLLGEQPTGVSTEFKAVFTVPYAAGKLRAVGLTAGKETETFKLTTAGPPAKLRLTPDRAKLLPFESDLVFVTVEATDRTGTLIPGAADSVTYSVRGPAEITAIGSADLTSQESYRANPRRLSGGQALVVVQTFGAQEKITLTAKAPGLNTATLKLR